VLGFTSLIAFAVLRLTFVAGVLLPASLELLRLLRVLIGVTLVVADFRDGMPLFTVLEAVTAF
jgi:hypothetical protein